MADFFFDRCISFYVTGLADDQLCNTFHIPLTLTGSYFWGQLTKSTRPAILIPNQISGSGGASVSRASCQTSLSSNTLET